MFKIATLMNDGSIITGISYFSSDQETIQPLFEKLSFPAPSVDISDIKQRSEIVKINNELYGALSNVRRLIYSEV